jgi:hypothetical protein
MATEAITNENLLDRNARLANRLGQVAMKWHHTQGHSGSLIGCKDDVCSKTVGVLEHNER